MMIEKYLIVTAEGEARVVSREPKPLWGQVVYRLNIDMPDAWGEVVGDINVTMPDPPAAEVTEVGTT